MGADDAGEGVTGEARRDRDLSKTAGRLTPSHCTRAPRRPEVGAALPEGGGPGAPRAPAAASAQLRARTAPREPRPSALVPTFAPKICCPAAAARPVRTCHQPGDSSPAAPAQLSASLEPPRAPRPRSLPGVPFPERGFEQRRDVRSLGVQVRRSAFRHLLPLAVAEAAATAAARPGALWEWRLRPRPAAGLYQMGREGGGRGAWLGGGAWCVCVCAPALCCPLGSPRAPQPGVVAAAPDL